MYQPSLPTIAAYFQYGIEAGILDDEQARAWALGIVDESDHPPLDIIEVLSSRNRAGLFQALKEVPGDRDVELAGRWLFGTLHRRLDEDESRGRTIARQALQVARSTMPESDAQFAFDGVDDCFVLAESGTYGSAEDCRKELFTLLEKWKSALDFSRLR